LKVLQFILLALAALAYRGLAASAPSQAGLSREVEEWFFLPTETSPLVVVLLAGWLVYRRRERLAALAGSPPAWLAAGALFALGTVAFGWAQWTGARHLLAVALLATGLGAAALHFGRSGLRTVAVPALLLLFAVPLPPPLLAEVVYHFQLWTAEYAGRLLFLIGRAAYVSGDQILLADHHFAVIEGCSGMRSVQTLTMVALLMVELFGRRGWHAVALVAAAPPVAFALNGLRVLALILNPHSEVVAIHNLQGVAILLGGVVLLYGLDGLLARAARSLSPAAPDAAAAPGADGDGPAGAADPADPAEPPEAAVAPAPWRLRARLSAAVLALQAVLSFAVAPWPAPPPPKIVRAADLAPSADGWKAEPGHAELSFLGTTGYAERLDLRYTKGREEVELFALRGTLEQRDRTPLSPKTVAPGSGWLVERSGPLEGPGVPAGARAARWYVMRSGTRRVLVHHWYEGAQGALVEGARSLLALDGSPWRRRRDILALRLTTDVGGVGARRLDRARERLARFEQAIAPDLERLRVSLERD